MKRVLIITYYWPPSGGAGVQRWLKFAKYLPEFGWEPVIYTPENPEAPIDDPSLVKDINSETVVIKRSIFEPYNFYKKFLGLSSKENINAGFLSEKEKPDKKEKLAIWIRGNFFIPDARKFWIKPSIRFLNKYITNNKIDAIISTGPPHSMHLIAQELTKKNKIPWIADFRDPWTGIDYYKQLGLTKVSDKKHHRLEKSVLQSSDKVIVIGKSMSQEFSNIADIDPEIISNGFDEDDFKKTDIKPSKDFTIVHVGSMNKDRNHNSFWEALSEIIKNNFPVKIKLIGKLDVSVLKSLKKYELQDYCEIIPYLSHNLIPSELCKASVLYLPINNTPNSKTIQTGKLFEYIASGKPILSVGPEDGDASDILAKTNSGLVVDFYNKEKIKQYIIDFHSTFISGENTITADIKQYSRRSLTEKLSQVLNSTQQK